MINDSDELTTDAYRLLAQSRMISGGSFLRLFNKKYWMSLGVWAMVQGEQTESYNIVQQAVNNWGMIRDNPYNALIDATQPIPGSVNQETQRAAWTIGGHSKVVSETRIYNLTEEDTDMLIHNGP